MTLDKLLRSAAKLLEEAHLQADRLSEAAYGDDPSDKPGYRAQCREQVQAGRYRDHAARIRKLLTLLDEQR